MGWSVADYVLTYCKVVRGQGSGVRVQPYRHTQVRANKPRSDKRASPYLTGSSPP